MWVSKKKVNVYVLIMLMYDRQAIVFRFLELLDDCKYFNPKKKLRKLSTRGISLISQFQVYFFKTKIVTVILQYAFLA